MNQDIVIIPSYWRCEFLYLCLEHLSECSESKDKEFWIFQDMKIGDSVKFKDDAAELEWVTNIWKEKLNIRTFQRPENGHYGNSYNVLRAYDRAYRTDAKYVYLVEDDIFVTKNFFNWHKIAQERHIHTFCSIAGKAEANDLYIGHKAFRNEFSLDTPVYRSLGVCWKRENLEEIIKHAVPEYYSTMQSMAQYIYQNFPDSVTPPHLMIEQDGLITRIMEKNKELATWTVKPAAYHVGIYGYHRGIDSQYMPIDTLPRRIDYFRKRLSDSAWLKRVADFQEDIQAYPL